MFRVIIKENQKLLTYVVLVFAGLVLMSLLFVKPVLPMLMGLVFGTTVALLNFIEMALTFYRAVSMPTTQAQKFAVVKYMMRFTLTAVVLLISFISPDINPVGTVIGLLTIKGVIYSTHLIKDKDKTK